MIDLDGIQLHHGDCREVLASLPDCSVDSVVTDPPYELGFMGKAWDGSGIAYSVEMWAEVLRVLKPGGHLCAFGGTRTYHRMACAIEDAGFEIRDSLHWTFASGFPKSLDVSKAIDKAAGAERETIESRRSGIASGHTTFGDDNWKGIGQSHYDITAAATDAAKQWEGWGTALKPAHEPIVLARKPLGTPAINVVDRVELELRRAGHQGEIRWSRKHANDAASCETQTTSSSIRAQPMEETSASLAVASEMLSDVKPTASSSEKTIASGERQMPTTFAPTTEKKQQNSELKSSTRTEQSARVAMRRPESSSPLTTSTEVEPSIEKPFGARSTNKSSAKDSLTVIESYVGIATGLSGSWGTVRIDLLSDGTFCWPNGLPQQTMASCTVAANVLTHGTGALNIDGARVDMGDEYDPSKIQRTSQNGDPEKWRMNRSHNGKEIATYKPGGRWPANVIFDTEAGALLDEQADGASRFFTAIEWEPEVDVPFRYIAKPGKRERNAGLDGLPERSGGVGDERPSGSFSERLNNPAVQPRANHHPTVKPLALMRWLVKLVTPPGGTVLEPFAGSGTTLMACVMEGFNGIGIEMTDEYLPIIEGRVRWAQHQPQTLDL